MSESGRERPSRDEGHSALVPHDEADLPLLIRVQILCEGRPEQARSNLNGLSTNGVGFSCAKWVSDQRVSGDAVISQMVNGWAGGGVSARGPAQLPVR
jgi:hypothetical protein